MKTIALAMCVAFAVAGAAEAKTFKVKPGPDAQTALQTALIDAKPGDTVRLDKGLFQLTDGLSLDVDDVTIRGAGQDKTILSFAGQKGAGEGLLVTSDRVLLRDFTVQDTKGDGIKAKGSDQIIFRDLRVEWTGGPKETNGAYGVYPVSSKNVLIESVTVRGASDAGIYVGQSQNIIVRESLAEYNVAGIEIENSFNADVYNNTATHNAGGILVFDLPGLPQMGGHSVRVFANKIIANDTPNFAPKGNIVGQVPTGTGVIIMANKDVLIMDNEIGENGTANLMLYAYNQKIDDPNYNPLPRNVTIRDNRFGRGGFKPAGFMEEAAAAGVQMPDILWDGADSYVAAGRPATEPVLLAIKDNISTVDGQPARFLSLQLGAAGAPLSEAYPSPNLPVIARFGEPGEVVLPKGMK